LAGPAAGGILVSATGYFWPFVIDSASFFILACVFLLVGLNRKTVIHADGEKPRAMDGFRFLFANPVLQSIMLLLMVVILALGTVSVGEVFLVVDELGASTFVYGIIGALFAGGALVGALTLQTIKIAEDKQSWGLVASLLLMVISLASLSLAPNYWFAGFVYFLAGIGNAGVNIFAIGQVQRMAKEETRGRIMAAVQGSVTSANAASLAIGGLLIGVFGVREVFFAAGILSLTALAIFGPRLLKATR
jgi:predicted MFS family arabinose efflux permease